MYISKEFEVLTSSRPKTIFLIYSFVMLKILPSAYQPYALQRHFCHDACGKIIRMPRFQSKSLVFGWKLTILVTLAFFLSACSVHTININPQPLKQASSKYSETTTQVTGEYAIWWQHFDNSELDSLIRSALENNFNLLASVARLEQARALVIQARADRLPFIDLGAQSEQQWREGDGREHDSEVGVLFSWEIDAFNRLDSIRLARQSEVAARQEDVEAIRFRLSSETAEAYFDAVAQQLERALLKDQIKVDEELLDLTKLRFESGLTSSVDMLQQSSQLAETQSLVPVVEAALRLAENRLDVLLGSTPDGKSRISGDADFAVIADLPFLGVPADLLINRPDLRVLRHEMVAADAEIGRAIAERLPQITLDGSLLYEDGTGPGGLVGTLLGTFIQPLVDWGARKAEVSRNKALYVERLALFTQRYLEAIEEVENSLYRERKQREFLDRLYTRRSFLQQTVDETTERYTNGLTDYLPVLDALKELRRLERQLVLQERALVGFRIQLHRALGGALPEQSSELQLPEVTRK